MKCPSFNNIRLSGISIQSKYSTLHIDGFRCLKIVSSDQVYLLVLFPSSFCWSEKAHNAKQIAYNDKEIVEEDALNFTPI